MNKIHLTSTSPFLDAELLINLQRGGIKIKQVEVSHFSRRYGEASGGKPSVILSTVKDMFSFWMKGFAK